MFTAVSIESCNNETPKINFGKDMCAFCKMTVIDEKFGALLINSKGKTLCFDCSECMVNYMEMDKDFLAEKGYDEKYGARPLRRAVEHYLEHGRCIVATIKALGYPSRDLLSAWVEQVQPQGRSRRTG